MKPGGSTAHGMTPVITAAPRVGTETPLQHSALAVDAHGLVKSFGDQRAVDAST